MDQSSFVIQIVLILAIVALAYLVYKKAYLPWKELQRYQKEFTAKGYKVMRLPFVPFGTIYRKYMDKNYVQHNDCLYGLKNQWCNYDIVMNNFFSKAYIQIVNPNILRDFFQIENQRILRKFTIFTTYLVDMFGTSIIFSQGNGWKHKRRVLTQFLNFAFVKASTQRIDKICKKQIDRYYQKGKIQGEKRNGKPVAEVQISEMLQMITSTVVTDIFFGAGNYKSDEVIIDGKSMPCFMRGVKKTVFQQSFNTLSILFGTKFVKLGIRQMDRRYNKEYKNFKQITRSIVHQRLAQIQKEVKQKGPIKQPKDFVQAYYMDAQQGGNKNYAVQDLVSDFANLYTAGTDSTQYSIMMMIYFVNKNPSVKQKLLKQFKQHNLNPENLTYENVKNLTYLDAVLYETMRLYQPSNGIFPRQILTDISIGGVTIKAGDVLIPQSHPIQYKEEVYQNAKQFIPQRWIDEEGKMKITIPYCWNSFSNGIRNCVGKQLALQQIRIFGAYFFSKYDTQLQTFDLKLNFTGFSYAPQHIKMKFWERA